ncbi:hypothetical protein C2G38_2040981 [Gigaspora rosea]|uniref:Uncharacterized protein n=1 Tax=Gigaspora rosea TaxID=44941 RepID=A0A397V0L4_9GLOM|nr:hypothetical protein C2G38_2040981 [Gigaspora rosea]
MPKTSQKMEYILVKKKLGQYEEYAGYLDKNKLKSINAKIPNDCVLQFWTNIAIKKKMIKAAKMIITWKKDEEIDEKDYVCTFIISPLEQLLSINLLRYVTIQGWGDLSPTIYKSYIAKV